MKTYKKGDKISFRLDGRWEGSGEVIGCGNHESGQVGFIVKLDKPVKEWFAGDEILVWSEEVCDD